MMGSVMVDLRSITRADVSAVASFLNERLNHRVSTAAWAAAMTPMWMAEAPNRGYMLVADGQVVGAYLAFYSTREVADRTVRVCNLGAWCVIDDFRSHSLRLLRAMLAQRADVYTDLSPSGNVVALNHRLKFQDLPSETFLVPNIPWPTGVRIIVKPKEIDAALSGPVREIYRDHASLQGARHLLVAGERPCWVMYRKERRKGLPLFGSILYVSDSEVFRTARRRVYWHLLLRSAIPFTLAERRVVGDPPRGHLRVHRVRPKMFRSSAIGPTDVDYLYSELASVAW
jgi:hypothetical protein